MMPQPQLLLLLLLAPPAGAEPAACCAPVAATRLPSFVSSAAASAACLAACARRSAGPSSQSVSCMADTQSTTSLSSTTSGPPRQRPHGICSRGCSSGGSRKRAGKGGRRLRACGSRATRSTAAAAAAAAVSTRARSALAHLQLQAANGALLDEKGQLQVVECLHPQPHVLQAALACVHSSSGARRHAAAALGSARPRWLPAERPDLPIG